jgi:hypothetical protein
MTISRWKIMACSLGLSLGSLAIYADQPNNKSNSTNKPTAQTPQATEPPPSVVPASKTTTSPMVADTLPPATLPTPPISIPTPAVKDLEITPPPGTLAPPVAVEQELIPDPPAAPNPEKLPPPMAPSTPPPVAKYLLKNPGTAPIDPLIANPPSPMFSPPPSNIVQPISPPPTVPPGIYPPSLPHDRGMPPMITSPPTVPLPPIPPSIKMPTSKLKMLVRLGDGKPRFEIRNSSGENLLLKVYGEKIEMQSVPDTVKGSPIAGVAAIGKVRFTGPGVEGTCDQLSILSGTGEVMLKGNIHLKSKRGKTWSEITTEKMVYQVGTSSTAPSGVRTAAGVEGE